MKLNLHYVERQGKYTCCGKNLLFIEKHRLCVIEHFYLKIENDDQEKNEEILVKCVSQKSYECVNYR